MTLGRLEQREADILRRTVRLRARLWRPNQALAACHAELEAIHDQILTLGVPAHVQIELRQSMAVAR